MKRVNYQQFKKDYCKNCIYNKICSTNMEKDYVQKDRGLLNYLATMIYGRPTIVMGKVE